MPAQKEKSDRNAEREKAKREQDAAKAKALREKELNEIQAGRDAAYLELLTDQEAEEYKVTEQYVKLIELAIKYGGIDGSHHKLWVIDQMVRVLAGKKYKQIYILIRKIFIK